MSAVAMTELDASGHSTIEHSTISWGAVIAGGFTTAALSLLLLALGIGLGLSSISPWADHGVSATTFKVGAGVYLVAIAMLSGTIGGYISGRMRAAWAGVHNDELYFRDTAHGLITWAFATVLSASALGAAISHIVGGTAAGAVPAATSAAFSAPVESTLDALLRNDAAPVPSPQATAGNLNATRAELGRLIVPVLPKGQDLSAADRSYVARIVANRTGLTQDEADKRVSAIIAQAKKATDDARKATAALMLWLAASLLAGAVASMLGATEGGVLRDSKWYEPGWHANQVRSHI
jgi:hypothetical protein